MAAKIGLMHGGHGMLRHRVTINPLNRSVRANREEITEDNVTPEMRRCDNHRDELWREHLPAKFDSAPDTSVRRTAVKSRADLVVIDWSVELLHRRKDAWEIRGHPFRRARAAVACDTKGLNVFEACKLVCVRQSE